MLNKYRLAGGDYPEAIRYYEHLIADNTVLLKKLEAVKK